MSTINAANLELQLVQKINSTTNEFDLLALSTALRQLKNGAVFVVQQFVNLPPAVQNVGQLYFVIEDSATYVSVRDVLDVPRWQLLVTDSLNVVYTWGLANNGQLGDGTVVNKISPVSIVGGIITWCAISAGRDHNGAVKTDGTLWTWGSGSQGRLGDGVQANRSSPVSTAGGGTNWCSVSAGSQHTGAVKTDGTLWTWGGNSFGNLGDGSTSCRLSPGTTAGGGSDWCAVSAADGSNGYHTIAVKTTGTIWTWGLNTNGQLGNGNTTSRNSPGTTVGCGTDWCSIQAGGSSTSALKTTGTLWTWGLNTSGQLGNNSTIQSTSPITTAGGGTTWCQNSVGNIHMSAVKTDGTLWTWGGNVCGVLGDGTVTNISSPGTTVNGGTEWCQTSSGRYHNGAVKTDGTLWTWGSNVCGRLGDNSVINRSSPVTTSGGGANWCVISAGSCHTVAIASRTL